MGNRRTLILGEHQLNGLMSKGRMKNKGETPVLIYLDKGADIYSDVASDFT